MHPENYDRSRDDYSPENDCDPCAACDEPVWYDEATGQWFHVESNAPDCFLSTYKDPAVAIKRYVAEHGAYNGLNASWCCDAWDIGDGFVVTRDDQQPEYWDLWVGYDDDGERIFEHYGEFLFGREIVRMFAE